MSGVALPLGILLRRNRLTIKQDTIWIYLAEDSLRPPPAHSQLGSLLLAQPYK
jgi:hypothetical protein